ncbi:BA75_00066T0 [Komagataella pastoris]|uniref:NEDD8-activating enzyme E1 regulatory subunit n=1 Tax=Komagataella pastoris TaxID=4922 RepID=A0A1B2J9N3_PICPA|nr:BA75_00066T0 [Komagataella pastoris]
MSEKYDRQLRLWAQRGQYLLRHSNVCLLGATTTGTEALKNLVLPGCGKFTIVDSSKVTTSDLETNFFLTQQDLGSNKAAAVVRNLNELNPDVEGRALDISLTNSLVEDTHFWSQFSLIIIASSWHLQKVLTLADTLWHMKIPLIHVSTIGFYGYMRIYIKEHTITESHPESFSDFRIDYPWKELKEMSDSVDLEADDKEHIPYLLILIKALDRWKFIHEKQPSTPKEKAQFKQLCSELQSDLSLQNFEEAVTFSWRASQVSTQLPENVKTIINDPILDNLSLSTPLFWIYVKALKLFIEKNGQLPPLPGVLPDLHSSTETYIKLQHIYKAKAEEDINQFTSLVSQILLSIGRDADHLDHESIRIFCKNSRYLFLQRGSKTLIDPRLIRELGNTPLLSLFIAFIATHKFMDSHSGVIPQDSDYNELISIVQVLLKSEKVPDFLSDIVKEILRSKGTQLHNICSFMGGIVGQEAVKLITGQYIPLENSLVFDGINSCTEKWKI